MLGWFARFDPFVFWSNANGVNSGAGLGQLNNGICSSQVEAANKHPSSCDPIEYSQQYESLC
jgi:hypothetical protein